MNEIKKDDSLEEYQKKAAHNNRIITQAKAVMKRAKNSGIPNKYLRINQEQFRGLISGPNADKITDFIFQTPLEVLKREFIVIDGGDSVQRKKAGCAILFRLIACDKYGLYKDSSELAHHLQSIKTFENEYWGRNDIAESLRDVDVLYISECQQNHFRPNFETGSFFDEILSYRDDHVKTTIVSFSNPLPSGTGAINSEHAMTDSDRFGHYMCALSHAYKKKDKRFFKVRVKTNG